MRSRRLPNSSSGSPRGPDPAPTVAATSSRIVITGPTGWIGTALLEHLSRGGTPDWSRRVALFGTSAREVQTRDGTRLPVRPLAEIVADDVADAIVIHLAYLTKEKVDLLGERVFTETNIAIDDRLLAALEGARPHSLFVASSGAARLAETGRDRHPYGLSKLRQEDRLLAWGARRGVPVLAGRIFNLAGPYINKIDSYAIGSFAQQARRGTIRIDAKVAVFRSFLHIQDLCALIIRAGTAAIGHPRPIDLCGSETVEMGEMAVAVARASETDPTIERDPPDWSQSSVYVGDSTQTQCLAARLDIRLAGFARQVEDTVEWLTNVSAESAHPLSRVL